MENITSIKRNAITILIVLITILVIKELATYFKDKIIVSLGGYTTQTTTTTIDSTFIKGKVDTLAVFNHYVKVNGIILNPKAKVIYVKDPVKEDIVVDSLKEFTVNIKDSLIDGKLTVLNKFNGDLKSAKLKYKPLFPKYIKRVDTIYINKLITKTLTKDRSLIGLGIGYNNLQYLSVLGSYTTKKKLQIIYEYGKSLDRTKAIINGIPFDFQTDDLHSIKIIKHF